MKKTEKANVISSLSSVFSKSTSVVFVDSGKMNVAIQQGLKKELKKADARLVVAKNTLIKLAANEAKLPNEISTDEILFGQTAIIYTDKDSVAPIQILGSFLKQSEIPQPKAGVIDGVFYDKAGIMTISALPSKQTLYGQVVGSMLSPIYGVLGTLQGNLQKLVYILNAKAAQG